MDQNIQDFINCKRIAVVGASRDPKKFGNMAYKELKQRGYQQLAINPQAQEIDGDPCYPNLEAVKDKAECVVIMTPKDQTPQILREAAQAGFSKIWLQQMAESPEALAVARELNLNLVSSRCILMYAQPVGSFHAWHRFFAKLFGQL